MRCRLTRGCESDWSESDTLQNGIGGKEEYGKKPADGCEAGRTGDDDEFAWVDASAREKGGWPEVWPCPCGELWACGLVDWEEPSPSALTGRREVERMWGLPGRELGSGGGGEESKKASGPEEEFAVYNERADGAELERTLDIALADVEGAETARGSAVQNRFWMVFIVGRGALMV